MSNIKLQPVPRPLLAFTDQDNPDEWETLCAIVRNYAREAVLRDRAAAPHILGPLHTGMPVDFDAIIADIQAIDTRHRGDPSYEHDPVWVRSTACDVVRHHAVLAASQTAQPPGREETLFEHEDGRYATWPGAGSPPWTNGDAKWHRVGPVRVCTTSPAAHTGINGTSEAARQKGGA